MQYAAAGRTDTYRAVQGVIMWPMWFQNTRHFQSTKFFVNAGRTASEAELSPALTKKWALTSLKKILRAHHVFVVFCRRICLLSFGFGGLQ